MKNNPMHYAVAAALVATLALSGCKKNEEPAPAPAAVEPAPAPTPAPITMATASVNSVELGNAVGTDFRVTTPLSAFGRKDNIIAAVSTSTSDPAASVPGKLGARWTFQDGQLINEESKDVNFTGNGVTDFQISKPDGWPAGNYKVEISLDGAVVQSREFSVK